MGRRESIFNWNHISEKLTEKQISELKALYKFYHKKYWLAKMAFKYFKSHFLRISRIERHSEKIEFFFILPKHPFG